MSTPSSTATTTEPQVATIEPDYLAIPYRINFNAYPDRTKANQRYEIGLLAMVALLLTIIDVLVASKSLGLSLLIMPEVLGVWWIVLQLRRLLYLRR